MTESASRHDTAGDVTSALLQGIGSRHAAAEILERVAEEGSCGHWPSEISGEELGMALWRVALNGPSDPDPLVAILRGWHRAESAWRAQLRSSGC